MDNNTIAKNAWISRRKSQQHSAPHARISAVPPTAGKEEKRGKSEESRKRHLQTAIREMNSGERSRKRERGEEKK